jgi:streptomycin 6-kinase
VCELRIPRLLAEAVERQGGKRRAWLDRLPGMVADLAQRWSLRLSEPFEPGGVGGWVAPALGPADEDLVLKVGWRHPEGEHEADWLRINQGRGSVLLHAAETFEDTSVLLVERARPGRELGRSEPEPRQDEIVSGLLTRFWVPPPAGHPFQTLTEMCDQWAAEYEEEPSTELDPGLAADGVAMFRSLPREAGREALLLTDLHAANILSAEREPWLVIDPKPYVGDPAYDPVQHMLNCWERLQTDPWGLSDRMADLCGLDRDRLRSWLFARAVVESSWWEKPGMAELATRLAPR